MQVLRESLLKPMCTCDVVKSTDLIINQKLFLIRVEYKLRGERSISTLKVLLEESFGIDLKNGRHMDLLGFTVHEGSHYYAFIFTENDDEVACVKIDDKSCVEVIPNAWYEIHSIDSDINKRPTTFIYGEASCRQQQYFRHLSSKIKQYTDNDQSAENSSSEISKAGHHSSISGGGGKVKSSKINGRGGKVKSSTISGEDSCQEVLVSSKKPKIEIIEIGDDETETETKTEIKVPEDASKKRFNEDILNIELQRNLRFIPPTQVYLWIYFKDLFD